MLSHNRKKKGGFTLIELIVVVAILVVISGIIISAFVVFNHSQAVDKDTEMVVETLRLARSQTLASKNATQYGVHFSPLSITLFSGSSYVASASTNVVFSLHSGDTISSVTIPAGGEDVIFDRLTGATTDAGTVTVSSADLSLSKSVTIYSTGLIQSPAL